MWLTSTLIWWITVYLMICLRTECYPRTYPRTFQQGGSSSAKQQLLDSQFQAAISQSLPKINDPVPQQRQKKMSVICHDETIELVMNAELLGAGFPVYAEELWLGPGMSSPPCGAVQTAELVFTIIAYFKDCGTTLSVTGDSLVYSNVLVYSPLPSPDGVLRQEGAVIPILCQFQRRYNVDSAAVAPAWVPYASTISSTDYLDFALRLMTDDWQYERGSNVYFLGDAIHLQASVTLANHLPLLLFFDWCVATPTFNFDANDIKYSFVDYHGCLSDSRSLYSHSKFLQRSEGNKLNLLLDAFRFHKLTSNSVYITCYVKVIPAAYSVSAQNRACSFIDGRWQSVDGKDEVCNSCEPSKQGAAEPEQIKPFRITQAPPVMQPKAARKSRPADFVEVIPGQSLEPYRALIQSRQFAYDGLSKRETDSNKDWKLATLGPLLLIPKEGTTTQSVAHPRFGPAEVFSASVTEEPEFLFNLTHISPVTDELDFKTAPETRSFRPFEDGLVLNASVLFGSDEGSGFE